MSAIETRALVHIYKHHVWDRPQRALNGLDLTVEEGEIFGFLGANGAGKTTTIKILVGLHAPNSGSASLFGIPVREVASRRAVGFQPENPYFYEYLTARETMHFYASLCEVPRAQQKKRIDELFDFMGLTEAAEVRVKQFSKGMRQRLGIAQALVHHPRLVILDEPMSGLDPMGRAQVREAILLLKAQGMTVFFSSHVLGDVEMICDRVGLLVEGKLQACKPVRELLDVEERRIEVGAEGLMENTITALSLKAQQVLREGERLVFFFPDWPTADDAVETIRQAGAHLTLLHPQKETLEEYFMRSTGRGRVEVGTWSGGGDR